MWERKTDGGKRREIKTFAKWFVKTSQKHLWIEEW